MGHYVYKYVFHNEIIYIGKNDTDLYSRLRQHGQPGDNIPEEGWDEINNSDIFYCKLPNRTMSDVVESELIRRYKPKWNKAKMSEWDGIDFVEPKWERAFEKNNDDIIKEKDCEIANLKSKIVQSQKDLEELQKLKHYRTEFFSLAFRYDKLLFQTNNNCSSNENSYEFDDICNWYKKVDSINGLFEAITYDSKQNITSYKKIYVDFLGRLYFEFEQIHRTPVKGIIFDNKFDTVRKNWQVLRNWLNAGTNEYIKVV